MIDSSWHPQRPGGDAQRVHEQERGGDAEQPRAELLIVAIFDRADRRALEPVDLRVDAGQRVGIGGTIELPAGAVGDLAQRGLVDEKEAVA